MPATAWPSSSAATPGAWPTSDSADVAEPLEHPLVDRAGRPGRVEPDRRTLDLDAQAHRAWPTAG